MRRTIAFALLLAFAADAGPRRVSYHLRSSTSSGLAFSMMLDSSGRSSMATGASFYTTFSSQFTGSAAWFFDAVNAQEKVGNFSFSAVGAPTTTTEKLCGNGGDCATTTSRVTSSGNVYKSANTASPAGDFSCVVVSRSDLGATGDVLSKNGASILFRQPPGGGTTAFINSGAFTAGANSTARAWNFFLLTYHPAGAGSSVGTTYFNSKSSSGSSSTLGLVGASTNPWVLGAFDTAGTTNPFQGRILYAGCSETIWSADTIAAMHDAAIGALVASVPLTTGTRTGPLTCTNDSWVTFTTVPPNRSCVASNALYLQRDSTNIAPQSEDITTTTYTATNVTSTADTTVAPDGTTTADTAQSTSSGGLLETTTGFLPTTGANHVASIWVKTSAGTQAVTFTLRDSTAGADVCTTSPTATTAWQRISCSGVATNGNTLKLRIYPGGSGGTGTTIWFGAQVEAFLQSSYIRTVAASVARGAQNFSVSLPSMRDSEGCIAATVNATSAQVGSNTAVIGTGASATYAMHIPVANTSVAAGDGTTTVTKSSLTSFAGRSTPLLSRWFGSSRTVEEVGVAQASGAYDGTFLGGTTFYLGTDDASGNGPLQGLLSVIKIGTTKDACQ